jgi:hypothetical protein
VPARLPILWAKVAVFTAASFAFDRPTTESVTVNGRPHAQHTAPLYEVGALLVQMRSTRGVRHITIYEPGGE